MTHNLPLTPPPVIAAVHDLSGFGRCAETVIQPTLSSLGAQVCPLPTALLSTHTGGYSGFTFLDLSNEMDGIIAHWKALGIRFDAVYSGFLANASQIEKVLCFVENCREQNPDCLFFADPVMGDDGRRYATYTDELCRLTRSLTERADVITPNVTEACLLLDIPYQPDFSDEETADLLEKLGKHTPTVVITGLHKDDRIGAAYRDKVGRRGAYFTPRDPHNYPGTGDIFASVVLGLLLKQTPLADAVRHACDFVHDAAAFTTSLGTPVREGLAFEPLLSQLTAL